MTNALEGGEEEEEEEGEEEEEEEKEEEEEEEAGGSTEFLVNAVIHIRAYSVANKTGTDCWLSSAVFDAIYR